MLKLFVIVFFFALYLYGCAAANKSTASHQCADLESTLDSAMAKFVAYYDIDKSIISDRKCTAKGLEFTWRVEGPSDTTGDYIVIINRMMMYRRPDGSPDVVKLHDISEKRTPMVKEFEI